jgi:hypothetical protein
LIFLFVKNGLLVNGSLTERHENICGEWKDMNVLLFNPGGAVTADYDFLLNFNNFTDTDLTDTMLAIWELSWKFVHCEDV